MENGVQVVPNERLISKNARDRFLRWQDDLKRAEEKSKQTEVRRLPEGMTDVFQQYETAPASGYARAELNHQRDHASAVLTGTWNEGQPDSPYQGSSVPEAASQQLHGKSVSAQSRVSPTRQAVERSPLSSIGASLHSSNKSLPQHREETATSGAPNRLADQGNRDGTFSPHWCDDPKHVRTVSERQACSPRGIKRPLSTTDIEEGEEDMITDTVGAIAVDEKGNIAAGSSSGGIGMKHRGRMGPAALVGIGTAVVPCHPDDPERVSVATVTSGTGEHMATTMASQTCAERIYGNTRQGPYGRDVEEWDEDAIMESFITDDFMGHPGVKNCSSVGAIGVMSVKMTRDGYYLYFAHNTDSFALASMSGSDKVPECVMSRLGESARVTRGGRRIKADL